MFGIKRNGIHSTHKAWAVFGTFVALSLAIEPALAANSGDWVDPGVKVAEEVKTGLTVIGGVIIGLGMIFVGLIAAAFGKMDWSRMGYVVLGGIIVMVGPAAVMGLMEIAKAAVNG